MPRGMLALAIGTRVAFLIPGKPERRQAP